MRNDNYIKENNLLSNDIAKAKEEAMIKGKSSILYEDLMLFP